MAKGRRINCWEFKQCGMDIVGDCPAYPTGGRICYMLAGTLCGGQRHGGYEQKSQDCMQCDFYLNEILNTSGQQNTRGTA